MKSMGLLNNRVTSDNTDAFEDVEQTSPLLGVYRMYRTSGRERRDKNNPRPREGVFCFVKVVRVFKNSQRKQK